MRCDNCQYWTPPEGDEWEPVRAKMGRCKRTMFADDMTEWGNGDGDDDPKRIILPEYIDRTAAAIDASGYSAGLLTSPDHFCAMFPGSHNNGATE